MTQKTPFKLHPGLVALFTSAAIIAAVLYVELPTSQPIDLKRLREDTRRDLKTVLDTLRHE